MANYQQYAEYKSVDKFTSNYIPSHWVSKKLKWEIIAKSGTDNKDDSGLFDLYGANGIIGKTSTFIDNNFDPKILIGRVGSAGSINYLAEQAGVSDNAIVIKNIKYNIPRYDYYLLKSLNLKELVSKNAQPLITASNIKDILVAVPEDENERFTIANFLDFETAKIDTLIEKQQTLIRLLQEKRQAVISHAVTKGLNPDAPMKDSGVEWLGEVPEHWVRASIKNLCYVNDGNHGEEYPSEVDFVEKGEGVPFIRGGDFDDFRIVSNNLRYISHEKNKSMRKGRLQENDILFVNRGATIGKLCIIDKDYVGSNLNSQIAYLRADKTQIDFRYLTYFLSSSYTQTKIISSIYGGALPQYSIQNIINLDVWYGSVEEQSMIADYLDKQVKVITYLIGKAERAIQLMQERRTALISAAVTGKIDVRGWRAPE